MMSSGNDPTGASDDEAERLPLPQSDSMERQLFESLVHHLIEKGVLTKNDALSVVQTVAQVKRGELESGRSDAGWVKRELVILERLYSSFELVKESALTTQVLDGGNVLRLRPPLHGDKPKFPKDD